MTSIMNKFTLLLIPLILFSLHVLLPPQVHAERVYLDITASDVRKIVVAIPDFQNQKTGQADPSAGRAMAGRYMGPINQVVPNW